MKYCVECGTKLEEKFLEGEGVIPFCPSCEEYRFPIFNTAVSMMVICRQTRRVVLIKQYGRDAYILVAGYVNKGEAAEETVVREVYEELGLEVTGMEFNKTKYFAGSNTLMINFACFVETEDLSGMTKEVDEAEWFTFEEARTSILQNSLAQEFLENYLTNQMSKKKD